MYRAQDHQFRIALLQALASKKIPKNRNIAQARNFVIDVGHPIIHQARDHKALPILQLKFSFSSARAKRGHGKPGDRERIGKVQGAHFRSDFQMNIAVGHDHGSESRRTPKSLNEMVTAVNPSPGWTIGKGNWPPARKLASLPFTAIRLGSARICRRFLVSSAWMAAPRLMSDRNKNRFRTLLMVGGRGCRGRGPAGCSLVPGVMVWGPKPPNCPVVIVPTVLRGAGRNEIDSQLRQGGAVHFGEFYLQQNFLGADRPEGKHVHDPRRIGAGQFSGALGDVFGGNMAGEHDGGARWRDGDLFVGEDAVLFVGASADVDIHAQIEAPRTLQFIPDEQRNLSWGFP